MYFWRPVHAIVAAGTATRAARRGANGRFQTDLENVRWLDRQIFLREMREAFPDWMWTKNCSTRATLRQPLAELLWDFTHGEMPPTDEATENDRTTGTGGGFGDALNNRIVEKAAVHYVTKVLKRRQFVVTSRESEKIGYDLDAVSPTETLHVEVKGTAGAEQAFIISGNELKRAETDAAFRLILVTNATAKQQIHEFDRQKMLTAFDMQGLSFRATLRDAETPATKTSES